MVAVRIKEAAARITVAIEVATWMEEIWELVTSRR
jgi:hypothetical protein